MDTITTTAEAGPSPAPCSAPAAVLTRQQRRHAKQAAEYQQAVAKQGKRFIKGFHNNPKGLPHVGAKQLAKMARQNADVQP